MQNEENLEIVEIDFENDLKAWRYSELDVCSDGICEEVQLSQVLLAQVNIETEEAKHKELRVWLDEHIYDEVEDDGQNNISVRWVITPKYVDGQWTTKARLVARGFEEDASLIRTDSPTCMRESLRIVLAYAACSAWKINSIDIKAAFLQGKQINRDVFLRPPKESQCNGKLWKLKKVVYGLSDASRVWYLRVVEELKILQVEASKFDKAFFIWKSDGKVEGLMVVHVDNFLWAGSESFFSYVIKPLKSIFKISKEFDTSFKYGGINMIQKGNYILLDQKSYIDSINPIVLEKKDKDILLNKDEKRSYRGLIGQLNWASGVTRPDISFNSCQLSTVQSNPRVSDLVMANRVLADLKREQLSIKYVSLDTASLKIVVFADASYANLPDGGSQGGHMIYLADKHNRAVPLAWSSKRIRRIVRSTLSAETLSAVDSLDSAYLIMKILGEVIGKTVSIDLFTDNKSMYDSICTTNYVLDKRLRVEIASLRELFETGEVKFHWISADRQIADVLTKRGASRNKLFSSLRENKLDME